MSDPWADVLPSVTTSLVTTLIVLGGSRVSKATYKRRRYAFRLAPGYGPIWYLTKLHKPVATNVQYHVLQEDLTEKLPLTTGDEMDPAVPGYGVWHLEPGDTIEIYWRERGKQHSTFQKIFPDQREYLLRRENTGH